MNINELIKRAHENAVKKGFYPEGENKNIGELLMLIVSELGEALEAHRKNRFADIKGYNRAINDVCYYPCFFEDYIKELEHRPGLISIRIATMIPFTGRQYYYEGDKRVYSEKVTLDHGDIYDF